MPPDPPSVVMLCMPVCFTNYECKYLTSPTSTMISMTGLVVPPLFKSLDPPLACPTPLLSKMMENTKEFVKIGKPFKFELY